MRGLGENAAGLGADAECDLEDVALRLAASTVGESWIYQLENSHNAIDTYRYVHLVLRSSFIDAHLTMKSTLSFTLSKHLQIVDSPVHNI